MMWKVWVWKVKLVLGQRDKNTTPLFMRYTQRVVFIRRELKKERGSDLMVFDPSSSFYAKINLPAATAVLIHVFSLQLTQHTCCIGSTLSTSINYPFMHTYQFIMLCELCTLTHVHECMSLCVLSACSRWPVLLWMVLTVVAVRGGEWVLLLPTATPPSSSSWEQPFSMART